eukprot:g1341.t1
MNPLGDNPFKGGGHRYTKSAGFYDRLRQNPVLGELKTLGVFCVNGTPNVEGGKKYALWYIAGCTDQKNLECQMDMRDGLGLLMDRSEMPYGRYWERCRGGAGGRPNIAVTAAFDKTVENYGKCVDADGKLKEAVYWGLDKVARTASKTPTAIMKGLKNLAKAPRAVAGNSLRANDKGEKSLNLKAYNQTKAATSGMSDGVVYSKTVGVLFPGGKMIQDVRKDRPPAAADFNHEKLQTFLKTKKESLKIGLCGERPTLMQDRLETINAEIRSKDDPSVVLVEEGDLEKEIKHSTDMYDGGGVSLRKHTRVIPNARSKSSRRVDYVSWVLVRTYGGLLRRLRPNLDIDFLSCTDTEFKNHLAVCLRAAAVGTLDNDDAIDTLTHLVETPQIMHTCQGLLRCALADESTTAMLWGPIIGDLYKFSKKKFGAFNQRVEREGAEEAKGGGGGGGSDDDSSSDDEGGSLATRLLFNSVDDYEFIEEDPAAEIAEAIVAAAASDQAEADATARADEAGRLHELQAAAGRRRSGRITARRKIADYNDL